MTPHERSRVTLRLNNATRRRLAVQVRESRVRWARRRLPVLRETNPLLYEYAVRALAFDAQEGAA
jgi:hypothetical protein